MVVQNVVIHVTAALTKEVTASRISAMKTPPLDLHQSLNKTNAKTNKGHDYKSQNQGIGGNDVDKGANPLYSFSNQGGDIGYNSGNSHGGSRILQNTPFQIKLC